MSQKLEELLLRWDDLRRAGSQVTVDDLCRDCPELRDELRAEVSALEAMDRCLALEENGSALTQPGTRCDELHANKEPIPGYRLQERLGKGGCGEVWKAIGPGGFAVALKFVPLSSQLGAKELQSLELLKTLHHPNLVATFGSWQVAGFLVIAMELADRTLDDRLRVAIKEGLPGIPKDELLRYMQDAAAGIDYLNHPDHRSGSGVTIQHRDIKPRNLLLIGGRVKVGDFGLLRVLKNTVTQHTGLMTPAYAPPEFLMGHTARSSDQYSLAITYCELRTGVHPVGPSASKLIQNGAESGPDLAKLPAEERDIVARALDRDPGRRWPSCSEVVAALIACHAPAPSSSTRPPLRRRRAMPATIGLIICIVAAGLFGAWLRKSNGPSTPDDPRRGSAAFIERGNAYYARKDYAKAIIEYTEAIRRDPKCALAYGHRAHAHQAEGRDDQAVADGSTAIDLDPLCFIAYYSRGKARTHKSQFNEAITDLSKAIELNPTSARAFCIRGNGYAGKGDFKQAMSDYNQAIKLDPTDSYAYRKRGAVYRSTGHRAQADADVRKAQHLEAKEGGK